MILCHRLGSSRAWAQNESEGAFQINSEIQRLVQNVILKLEKINMMLVKPVMVKHPSRTKLVKPVTVISATHTSRFRDRSVTNLGYRRLTFIMVRLLIKS